MSCQITRCVINIHELLMHTSVYQVFAINCLYNGHDLMVVQPTGSGKTIIFYLLALCFKKKDANSLIICVMPLSSIISQQAVNSLDCPVATMSMGATMKGTHIEAKGHVALTEGAQFDKVDTNCAVINDEDITSSRYAILFGHPEAFASKSGQRTLRALSKKRMIKAILVDEVHQGLDQHWSSFRPGMLRNVLSCKVHAVPKSPIGCFTATITKSELREINNMTGRSPMLVVASGPIQSNFKVCLISRPPSQTPFLGCLNSKGVFQPGLLHLLRLLTFDDFLEKFHGGDLGDFPPTIVFFRDSLALSLCNSYLMEKTGLKTLDVSPWAANHSNLSSSDDSVLQRRMKEGSVRLYLSTNR